MFSVDTRTVKLECGCSTVVEYDDLFPSHWWPDEVYCQKHVKTVKVLTP